MFRKLLVCLYVFTLFSLPAFAAEISKVKGKSVLIDLKGSPANVGDEFYALSSNGKRSGIVKVAKVKGDKAIGRILKGRVQANMSLESKNSSASSSSRTASQTNSKSTPSDGRSYWGLLLGYGMDSMSVNVNNSSTNVFLEKVDLKGSGFSAKALFDYELFNQIWFRGATGLETFKATGDAKCGTLNQQTCEANISYLSLDFLGRYVFSKGSFRPWLGAGVGLLFPMSKSANAISGISTTNVIMIGGGFDIFTSPDFYIPVSVEYGLLPKSDEVEATWIAFRAGFAVPF